MTKKKEAAPDFQPAKEMTWEEYEARDQAHYDAARPSLVANDLEGAAKVIFERIGFGAYYWLDDHWKRMREGVTTTVTPSKLIDELQRLEWAKDREEMEAHRDADVLRAIASTLGVSVVSPRNVAADIDFKVITRKGRKLVRLGGYYTESIADDKGEFPPKVPVAEMVRVLQELGAREVKREKRPGRPTGYDGWAW